MSEQRSDDRITVEVMIFWVLIGLLMWLGVFRAVAWMLERYA